MCLSAWLGLLLLPYFVSGLTVDWKSVQALLPEAEKDAEYTASELHRLTEFVSFHLSEIRLNNRDTVKSAKEASTEIAKNGILFIETAKEVVNRFQKNVGNEILKFLDTPKKLSEKCHYNTEIKCDPNSIYRSPDGSCNNLNNPLWGKSYTPLKRLLPPLYEDSINLPRRRSFFSLPLPSPRKVSTFFHRNSSEGSLDKKLTHLAAHFGEFIARDLHYVPIMKGKDQSRFDCCNFDDITHQICMPISIPDDDYFFMKHRRDCMSFTRSLPTPAVNCKMGPREQLNQNTHYLDASQIYGSDMKTMKNLREHKKGLMKMTGETLPQDRENAAGCRLPFYNIPSIYCFQGGDDRLNEQPFVLTLHTIFVREHNRIAKELGKIFPKWNDDRLFEETRRIVIAEMQHITYSEYLPLIFGDDFMKAYGLNVKQSGYTTYNESVNPNINNVFASAVSRFPASMMRGRFHIEALNTLSSHFLRPDIFYREADAISKIAKSLVNESSQSIDELITDELTNKYLEVETGSGQDLIAMFIQRGRDHGLTTYPMWRLICGMPLSYTFTSLEDHSIEDQQRLSKIYRSVFDMDLWVGGISEKTVPSGKVGPTFACLLGKQFKTLKEGDRFWYESNGSGKFTEAQLAEIKQTTIARILCDNTKIGEIQPKAFEMQGSGNRVVNCSNIPKLKLCRWGPEIGWKEWSVWTMCFGGMKMRHRICQSPSEAVCPCEGLPVDMRPCQMDSSNQLGPAGMILRGPKFFELQNLVIKKLKKENPYETLRKTELNEILIESVKEYYNNNRHESTFLAPLRDNNGPVW